MGKRKNSFPELYRDLRMPNRLCDSICENCRCADNCSFCKRARLTSGPFVFFKTGASHFPGKFPLFTPILHLLFNHFGFLKFP